MVGRSAWAGVISLAAVILLGTALATIPTPLYPLYVREAGLDAVGITATFAAFAAGAVVGLAVAYRASGRLSRRSAYTIAAALQGASALFLAVDLGIPGFAFGRVVTGVGAGLLAASGTAFVIELATAVPPRAGRIVRAGAPALAFAGLGLGPVISALADPSGLVAVRGIFLVVGVAVLSLLGVSLVVLAPSSGRATAVSARGPRRLPWEAGSGAFAAFMTTGLFGSVTSLLLGELGIHDAPRAGAFAAAVFVAGAVGVVLLAPRVSLAVAGLLLAVGLLFVGVAVTIASAVFLGAAALVAGLAAGALFSRSLRTAIEAAPESVFTQTVAVFLCAYAGLAIPVLGFGVVAHAAGTDIAVWGFTGIGSMLCIAVSVCALVGARTSRAQAPFGAQERSLA